jgi:hypothetical protein
MVHGFATKEFANGGTKYRQTVTRTGVRSSPCPLKLHGPALPIGCDCLTQIDRSTITQLTRPMSELVATIAGGIGFHACEQCVTAQDFSRFPGFHPRGIKSQ